MDNSADTISRTRLKEILIIYTKPNWMQNSKKSAKCIPQHQLFVYLKYGIMKIKITGRSSVGAGVAILIRLQRKILRSSASRHKHDKHHKPQKTQATSNF